VKILKLPTRTSSIAPLAFAAAFFLAQGAQPDVGEMAPDFSLPSLNGSTVRLSEFTGHGPLALVILRGYPGYQCPLCNRQVQDFLRNREGMGTAKVVLVYPGPDGGLAAKAREFAAGKELPENFELLIDEGYKMTNLYGLRWDAPKETAYPSTFVIDRKGVIRFAKISMTHGGRTTAAELIEQLKAAAR
jgi:peroxiredoxin Q/BCP